MTGSYSETMNPRRAPLLGTIMGTLTGVYGRGKRRCHAIVNNTDHRCREVYTPTINHIDEKIQQACNSLLPFDGNLSGKLTDVLLCCIHRRQTEHTRPLRLAFSSTPPDCALTRFSDARMQLLNKERKFRCIANNGPGKRCAYAMGAGSLKAARKIVRNSSEDGCEDEENEEVLPHPDELKPLIRLLLCSTHSHWFWLDLYNKTWAEEITRIKLASDESSEANDESSEANDESSEASDKSSEAEVSDRWSQASYVPSEASDESSEASDESSEASDESSEASDESSKASHDSRRNKSSKARSRSSPKSTGVTQEPSDEEEDTIESDSSRPRGVPECAEEPSDEEDATIEVEVDGPSSVAKAAAVVNIATRINNNFISASQEALDRFLDRLPAVSATAPASSPSTPQRSRPPQQHPAHTAPASTSSLAPEAQGRGVHWTSSLPDRRRRSAPASRATASASPLPTPDPNRLQPSGRPTTARSSSAKTTTTTAAEALLAESVSNLNIADDATPTKPGSRETNSGASGARQGFLASPYAVLPAYRVCAVEKTLGIDLKTQLGANDTVGDVYVLKSATLPGLAKIGKATNSGGRISQIGGRCKLSDLEMAYVEVDVPHPLRVEKLVHDQLQELRQLRNCDAEGTTHKEWYRCEADFAAKVVKAWARWMRQQPYANGMLRDQWSAKIQDLRRDPMLEKDETFVEVFKRHRRWMVQGP